MPAHMQMLRRSPQFQSASAISLKVINRKELVNSEAIWHAAMVPMNLLVLGKRPPK
jgi:hypothetical protein